MAARDFRTSGLPDFRTALLLLLSPILTAADLTPEQTDFFEKKVRPVLVEHCYECHSAQSKKVKGGLKLDTRAAVLAGGDSGTSVVAGQPDKSPLIKAVHWSDKDLEMPPKKKLTDAQIADLEAWVKMGAPDPRDGAAVVAEIDRLIDKGRAHWSFKPVAKTPVPGPAGLHPVDAFIRARLDAAKLKPGAPADARTLVRRLHFDLTGLPPTQAEVEAFTTAAAKNPSAAITAEADRLLASPRYGERWGRHWLDVTRYADTKGSSFNNQDTYPWSWSYRDWVVQALNDDLPYDQFVRTQLAADLLPQPPGDNRALAALGFYTVGRRTSGEVDDNVYDDRIDVIGRGLMAMTVGCARCHDHKLEPIRTKDYYALFHVLRSCKEPETCPELSPQPTSPQRTTFLAERTKAAREHTTLLVESAQDALASQRSRVGAYLLAAHDGQHVELSKDATIAKNILVPRDLHREIYDPLVREWDKWVVKYPRMFAPWLAFAALTPEQWPTQAPVLATGFATGTDDNLNRLVAEAFAGAPPKSLAEVAALYDRVFTTLWMEWQATASSAEADAAMPTSDEPALIIKSLDQSVLKRIVDIERAHPSIVPVAEELRLWLVVDQAPFSTRPYDLFERKLMDEHQQKALEKTAKALSEFEKHANSPARAMALSEGDPQNGKVYVRGNPQTQGAEAPRRFIEILGGSDQKPFPPKASGRRELAEAITDPTNPLTARVIVNRVWQWHFGEGLVRTPSDFGLRGEAPTHPELLDWLTSWFIENGWSMKKLHRLLLTSATWQQDAIGPSARSARSADPANRLWGRMDPQPLGFERFRDQVLAVSGRLDLTTVGGRPIDVSQEGAVRRSLYALIDRKALASVMGSFDFPDPSFSTSQRGRTVQSGQALWLLNSAPMAAAAKALALRARPDDKPTDDVAIRALYTLTYQRQPSATELTRAKTFIAAAVPGETVIPEARDWAYGVGEVDAQTKALSSFTAVTSFEGAVIKGRKEPTADASGVEISNKGGRTARQLALVRRWTAPLAGTVDLRAELVHHGKEAAGVTCRVVHHRSGQSDAVVGEWTTAGGHLMTERKGVAVKTGDILDFITVNRDGTASEAFTWAPTIIMPDREMPGMPSMPRRWDARGDFIDPAKMPQPIGPWQSLAQALLLANEAAWVD